jgi:hypothetical protein
VSPSAAGSEFVLFTEEEAATFPEGPLEVIQRDGRTGTVLARVAPRS